MKASPLQIHGLVIETLAHQGLGHLRTDQLLTSHEGKAAIDFSVSRGRLSRAKSKSVDRVLFYISWHIEIYFGKETYLVTDFRSTFSFSRKSWLKLDENECRHVVGNAVMLALSTGRGAIIVLTGVGDSGIVIPAFDLSSSLEEYFEDNGPLKQRILGEPKRISAKEAEKPRQKTSGKKKKPQPSGQG